MLRYPAMLLVEMYPLLAGLIIGQIGEKMARERLVGFETAHILLCALGHQT